MSALKPRADGLIRIWSSAKVDHLSRPDGGWEPLCGQRLRSRQWKLGDYEYPGVHLCRRCEAEAEE